MEAYGYLPVVAEGDLYLGDAAGFRPSGQPRAVWEYKCLSEDDDWPPISDRVDGLKVLLHGFLGPDIYPNDPDGSTREVFVAKVQRIRE